MHFGRLVTTGAMAISTTTGTNWSKKPRRSPTGAGDAWRGTITSFGQSAAASWRNWKLRPWGSGPGCGRHCGGSTCYFAPTSTYDGAGSGGCGGIDRHRHRTRMNLKILSGGQTGADRAAQGAAME